MSGTAGSIWLPRWIERHSERLLLVIRDEVLNEIVASFGFVPYPQLD